MNRIEFLAAVADAHPPVDHHAALALADHFTTLVDTDNGWRHHFPLPYAEAVVIEGDSVVVTHVAIWAADRVGVEARAGTVTSVLTGAGLLAGTVTA